MQELIESEKAELKNPLSELSRATISIIVAVILVLGGTSGGIVSRIVAPGEGQGLSQDKADLRYLSKEEAEKNEKQLKEQLEKFDKEMLKKEMFEINSANAEKRLDKIEKLLEEILRKQ